MSKKYKVTCGDQFLGHFYSKTPEEAAEKAYNKNGKYYKDVNVNSLFTVQKGGSDEAHEVYLTKEGVA